MGVLVPDAAEFAARSTEAVSPGSASMIAATSAMEESRFISSAIARAWAPGSGGTGTCVTIGIPCFQTGECAGPHSDHRPRSQAAR